VAKVFQVSGLWLPSPHFPTFPPFTSYSEQRSLPATARSTHSRA